MYIELKQKGTIDVSVSLCYNPLKCTILNNVCFKCTYSVAFSSINFFYNFPFNSVLKQIFIFMQCLNLNVRTVQNIYKSSKVFFAFILILKNITSIYFCLPQTNARRIKL